MARPKKHAQVEPIIVVEEQPAQVETLNGKVKVLILGGHLKGKEIELFPAHAEKLVTNGQAVMA